MYPRLVLPQRPADRHRLPYPRCRGLETGLRQGKHSQGMKCGGNVRQIGRWVGLDQLTLQGESVLIGGVRLGGTTSSHVEGTEIQ
jgi:hypothetical protein